MPYYYFQDCDIGGRNRSDIRLAGSTDRGSGRVEIRVGDQWGTICDVFWGLADAEVSCRDLGYSGALQATGGGCKYSTNSYIGWLTSVCSNRLWSRSWSHPSYSSALPRI